MRHSIAAQTKAKTITQCLRHSAAIVTALALVACATPITQRFPKSTPAAEVVQQMGTPSAEYKSAVIGRRIEYNGGAFGRATWMFDFDSADLLVNIEQVRAEPHFNTITAGMTAADVLSRIGKPSTTWPIGWQRQIVWSYRYETPFCQWFMVGMNEQGKVADTAYGPDPICDNDDFFGHMRRR